MQSRSSYLGPILLVIMTFIWGTAFLAQKSGAGVIGPFALTTYRNILGGGFLLLLIAVRTLYRRTHPAASPPPDCVRKSIVAGVLCGVPLFAAMMAQQVGIEYTTPGISAFLTTNYVLIVPFLSALSMRHWPSRRVLICAAMSLVGTYGICLGAAGENGIATLGPGELWTMLCAVLFSVQVLTVDHFAKRSDLLVMSAAQLLASAILGIPFLFLSSESARLHHFLPVAAAWWPIVYCGVFSSGIAYTLQNFGQARTPAPVAAVIMSLEAVFGALAGFVVRGDAMSPMQLAGCVLVFTSVVLQSLKSAERA